MMHRDPSTWWQWWEQYNVVDGRIVKLTLFSDVGETSASTVEGPASCWDVCIAIFVYSVSWIETGVAAMLRNVFFLRSTLRRRRFVVEDLWGAHDMICRRYFARDCRIYFLHERHYYFLIEPRSTKRKCTLKFAFSYTGMWIVNSRLAKHNLNSTNSFCRVLYFVIRAILLAVAECTHVHVFSALCVQTKEIVQPCFSMTIFYRNSTTICK